MEKDPYVHDSGSLSKAPKTLNPKLLSKADIEIAHMIYVGLLGAVG